MRGKKRNYAEIHSKKNQKDKKAKEKTTAKSKADFLLNKNPSLQPLRSLDIVDFYGISLKHICIYGHGDCLFSSILYAVNGIKMTYLYFNF